MILLLAYVAKAMPNELTNDVRADRREHAIDSVSYGNAMTCRVQPEPGRVKKSAIESTETIS